MAYLFFLHRAYPGCILLWLHSHTTSRWLVSIPLWWKGCVWLWSPFDISGSTVYSSCCLSQCCNFNVGESGGRSWTGSEIHWSLYQPKWIASLLLTMIFLTTQLSSASLKYRCTIWNKNCHNNSERGLSFSQQSIGPQGPIMGLLRHAIFGWEIMGRQDSWGNNKQVMGYLN